MLVKADLDEIVFRAKNKEYGAYLLRKLSPTTTRNAFIIGLGVMLLAIAAPWVAGKISDSLKQTEEIKDVEAVLTEPPPPPEEKEQPEDIKEPPPPPPKKEEVKFVPPTIVPDKEAPPETAIEFEKADSVQISTKNVEGDKDAPEDISLVPDVAPTKKEEIKEPVEEDPDAGAFVAADVRAAPVNMADYKSAVKYPEMLKEGGIQGKVILKVLVDKEGNIGKDKDGKLKYVVVKDPHPMLTAEAVKALPKLKFTPALQGTKAVKMWVVIPVDFKLQ